MDVMAKLIAATDRVAKQSLEDGRLTPRESSDVQETASLAEQWMPVIKQARIVVDTWNESPSEDKADVGRRFVRINKQMQKLSRMLNRVPVGRKS